MVERWKRILIQKNIGVQLILNEYLVCPLSAVWMSFIMHFEPYCTILDKDKDMWSSRICINTDRDYYHFHFLPRLLLQWTGSLWTLAIVRTICTFSTSFLKRNTRIEYSPCHCRKSIRHNAVRLPLSAILQSN